MKFYNAILHFFCNNIFYNDIFLQWNFTMQLRIFSDEIFYNDIFLQWNFTMQLCIFNNTNFIVKKFYCKKTLVFIAKKVGHPELLGSSTGSLVGYYSGGPAGQASAFIKPNPRSSRRSPSSSFSNLTLDYRFNYVTYLIT